MHTAFKLGVLALTLAVPIVSCDSNDTIDIPITRFTASLSPLNSQVGIVTGRAAVEIAGDLMRVTVHASGLDGSLPVSSQRMFPLQATSIRLAWPF